MIGWRIAALKNGFLDATAYRWEFFIEVLGSAFVPAALQLILWFALFDLSGKSTLQGYTYTEMIHYTLMSVLFSQIRGGNHDFELQEMIRSGQLSQYLLRPVSAVEFVYIRGVAPKILISLISLIVGIFVCFWLGQSPFNMFLGMLLALLGNIIHYQLGAMLACTAFYWEEAFSVLMVKNLIVGLLSGEMIPLNLIPESFAWTWKYTPFYLYVFGPAQIALGRWGMMESMQHFGIALCWLLFFWGMVKVTWAIGLKRYQSLGG